LFTVRLIAAFADTVIVWSLFYCCILLLLLWFGVGFVMWPALLLVVVFWCLFFVLLYVYGMFCVLSATIIVGIVCSQCRAGVDATP
jgi:hypothetical protein